VIEFWVDNSQMLEMMTPEMQREYQHSITIENWREMLRQRGIGEDGEPVARAASA
jgi:hypothetical protein